MNGFMGFRKKHQQIRKAFPSILFCFCCLFFCEARYAKAQENKENLIHIPVSAYHFPPFVDESGRSGLTFDLVGILNATQRKYRFNIHITSPKRRYKKFDGENRAVMFFEMQKWGWLEYLDDIYVSKTLTTGREIYIAKNNPESNQKNNQELFSNMAQKRVAAIYGYHYGFTNFRTDDQYLSDNFNILLVHHPRRVLDAVLNDRAQIGIVTYSYYQQLMKMDPTLTKEIIVSDRNDQIYDLRLLVHKKAKIPYQELMGYLKRLSEQGILKRLYSRYSLIDLLSE